MSPISPPPAPPTPLASPMGLVSPPYAHPTVHATASATQAAPVPNTAKSAATQTGDPHTSSVRSKGSISSLLLQGLIAQFREALKGRGVRGLPRDAAMRRLLLRWQQQPFKFEFGSSGGGGSDDPGGGGSGM